jgi:hypothetical protein
LPTDELITDLVLSSYLITSNICDTVTFHVKPVPYFVSDVTENDLLHTIKVLQTSEDKTLNEFASLWSTYLSSGKWVIKGQAETFWTMPLAYYEMPSRVSSEFNVGDLAIVKGDLNYRRLLGDRNWGVSASFDRAVDGDVGGWPCDVLALRCLKSETVCGMVEEKVEEARRIHPNDWSVNGEWGVVQLARKNR